LPAASTESKITALLKTCTTAENGAGAKAISRDLWKLVPEVGLEPTSLSAGDFEF
jgi:hypothetical protein